MANDTTRMEAKEEHIAAAVAKRDREWMEALHPGNQQSMLGKAFSTPAEYAGFAQAGKEIQRECMEYYGKLGTKLRRRTRKLAEMRAKLARWKERHGDSADELMNLHCENGTLCGQVTSLQRELAEAREHAKEVRLALTSIRAAVDADLGLARASNEAPVEVNTELFRTKILEAIAALKSRDSLTPLDDPSVRGVLVDDGEPRRRINFGEQYFDAKDGTVGWCGESGDYLRPMQPVALRPASDFGVAAREDGARSAMSRRELEQRHQDAVRVHHDLQKVAESIGVELWDVAGTGLLVRLVKEQVDQLLAARGERIKELEAELAKRTQERDEAVPFMAALKGRHNGYDPGNSKMFPAGPPATPEVALNELIEEQEWLVNSELKQAQSDAERLRKAIETHQRTLNPTGDGAVNEVHKKLWSALSPSPAAENRSNGSQGTHKPATRPQANEAEPAAATEAIVSAAATDPAGERIKELEAELADWKADTTDQLCVNCSDPLEYQGRADAAAVADAERLRKAIAEAVEFMSESLNKCYDPFLNFTISTLLAALSPSPAAAAESDKPYGLVEQMDAGEGTVYGRRVTVKRREAPAAESQGNSQHHIEGAKIPEGGSGSSSAESEGGLSRLWAD